MKTIIKAIKALWATLKDPHLLSSQPHHQEETSEVADYEEWLSDSVWDCNICRITHTNEMSIGFEDESGKTCPQCYEEH